jgi:hypothetical protein
MLVSFITLVLSFNFLTSFTQLFFPFIFLFSYLFFIDHGRSLHHCDSLRLTQPLFPFHFIISLFLGEFNTLPMPQSQLVIPLYTDQR